MLPCFDKINLIFEQNPTIASSMELSITSWIRWLGEEISVYIPGLFRTGSRPDRTSIDFAS